MKTNEQMRYPQPGYPRYRTFNRVVTATVFIIAGLLIIARNNGFIDPYIYNIIMSWPMLLIVIGITSLCKRNFWSGFILLAIGTYSILPRMTEMEANWMQMFWPVLLILIGLSILFKRRPGFHHQRWQQKRSQYAKEVYSSESGYVVCDNTFGSIKQIVLDPVFKGASIKNTFGGTILDLRRTKLEAPETYIDIDCSFGGIEIYMPSNWNLQSQINAVLGGCDDKRYNPGIEIDQEHLLIIRGNITFGGLEFKS